MALTVHTTYVPKKGPYVGQTLPLKNYYRLQNGEETVGIFDQTGETRNFQVKSKYAQMVTNLIGRPLERRWPHQGTGYKGTLKVTEAELQRLIGHDAVAVQSAPPVAPAVVELPAMTGWTHIETTHRDTDIDAEILLLTNRIEELKLERDRRDEEARRAAAAVVEQTSVQSQLVQLAQLLAAGQIDVTAFAAATAALTAASK